jgi:ABC-type amino acid transport system permease subunit
MSAVEHTKPKAPLIYNPKVRSIAYQVLLCAVIVFLLWSAINNAAENLARAKIASGFGFWDNTAGFDISQTRRFRPMAAPSGSVCSTRSWSRRSASCSPPFSVS